MKVHEATEQAYKNGYEQGKKDALKWIPVSERLPEKSEYYLAMSDGQCILVPYSHKHKAFNAFDTNETTRYQIAVTHWMPLPEPPKGE